MMSRSSLFVVPVVAAMGVWLGRSASPSAAIVLAILASVLAVAALDAAERARTRRLSNSVNAWMGRLEVDPVRLAGGRDVQQLATAINALGAAYARRGVRLTQSRPEVRDLVAALPEPALLFDDELRLITANGAARDVFTLAPQGAPTATQALGSIALSEQVRQTRDTQGSRRQRVTIGSRTLEAVTTPLSGRVLLLARDLTESLQVETLRRDFVANASHELKTPVAGIQALAEAMQLILDSDPARSRHLLGRIHGEADRLAALVSDLLSLRRVDEAVEPLTLERVDLAGVATDVVADRSAAADEQGVQLLLEADGDLAVRGIEQDLRLVVGNLVENAIRYNVEGGRVLVRVRRAGEQVVLEVEDSGIGIPGKELGRIFERFYRVDPGRSLQAGGTGLGLAIVRHAVERLAGSVEVTSLLGKGSTFTVRLPAWTT